MAEVDNGLLLEHLKAIQARMARMEDKIDGLGGDMRSIKTHMAGFMSNEVVQDAAIASLAVRLDPIERRLELRDET